MGDIKRKKGKFRRPRKPFDKMRIDAEKIIVEKYGLKNKKEIWKAEAEISNIRRRAKMLISKTQEEKDALFNKLNQLGFNIKDISDVLALDKEDWLKRRLQTFVVKKGLANTTKQARQLIVHKHVYVDGKRVNIPSFIVAKEMENKISLKEIKIKKPKEKKSEDIEDGKEWRSWRSSLYLY